MVMQIGKISLAANFVVLATAVTLLQRGAFGQSNVSPVRQTGASQFAGGTQVQTPSKSLIAEEQDSKTGPDVVKTSGSLLPWWEGMEEIAIKSVKVKRYDIGISLSAGLDYDDNGLLRDDFKEESTSYYLSSNLSASYRRNRWTASVNYSPQWRQDSSSLIDDSFNQGVSAVASYTTPKTSISLSLGFSDSDDTNVEAADRVEATLLTAVLSVSRKVSTKTTVGGSLSWSPSEFENFIDSSEYQAGLFADYDLTSKSSLGLGVGYTYRDVDSGFDSNTIHTTVRTTWRLKSYFGLRGNAGAEWREFDGGRSLSSPIYSVGFYLQPRQATTFAVDVYRSNYASIIDGGQSYYATGILASLSQRLHRSINLNIGAGFEDAEYEASAQGFNEFQDDSEYWFVRTQISIQLWEKLLLSLYYTHSDNEASTRSFASNRVGLNLTYTF